MMSLPVWLLGPMFLPWGLCPGVSVRGSLLKGLSVKGAFCERESLSKEVSVKRVSVNGSLCKGGLCEGVRNGDPMVLTCSSGNNSSWYASYWNAFLFTYIFTRN